MKITIDTKEDSPGEIRRVISMLRHMVEATGGAAPQASQIPEPSAGLFNMFGAQEAPQTATDEPSPDDDPDDEPAPQVTLY